MKQDLKHKVIRLIPAASIVIGLMLAVLLVMWVKNLVESSDSPSKKTVQQITIIAPPPPPPLPEEQPPEPEVEEEIDMPEEVADDVPEEAADPVGADLGVDADGTGAGDNFGLIGNKGGRSILDGSPFAYYEGIMVSEIQDLLADIDELKSQEYKFRIKINIGFDGTLQSVKMLTSTGDKEKDKMLLEKIRSFTKFSQMPPGKMPPVVDLRITSSI